MGDDTLGGDGSLWVDILDFPAVGQAQATSLGLIRCRVLIVILPESLFYLHKL